MLHLRCNVISVIQVGGVTMNWFSKKKVYKNLPLTQDQLCSLLVGINATLVRNIIQLEKEFTAYKRNSFTKEV